MMAPAEDAAAILCECGNTMVKLACGAERLRLAPAAAAAWLAQRGCGPLILAATGAASAAVVRAAWRGSIREAGRDLVLPDLGQYPGMGVDRILAGLAAGPDCIVVDAGTATTLTAWDGGGRCAGGLILPGARAMAAGLAACAPALPEAVPLPPGARASQRSTAAAIGAGIGIGQAAMAAACLARLRAETGCGRVIGTGGGLDGLALSGIEPRPWLVLEGLAALSAAGRA